MIHRRLLSPAFVLATLGIAACGGGDGGPPPPPPAVTAQILSNPAFDGDIQQTSPISYSVTQGMSPTVQSLFAGIDPLTRTEFRAFLDFPLTGAGGVPGNAAIDSAFLDIHVDSLQPLVGTLPVLIELVSFQQPMVGSDFDRTLQPPIASVVVTPEISPADVGTNISIDVTPLMVAAQNLNLLAFQVRIMEDLGPAIPILMEIDDTTGTDRATFAPLLTVTYF